MKLIEFIYSFGIFFGLFIISIVMISRRVNRSNIYLLLILAYFSYYLLENLFLLNGHIEKVPHLFHTSMPLIFLIPPLYYHYVCSSVSEAYELRSRHLIHLLPFFYQLVVMVPLYLLDKNSKIEIYNAFFNKGIEPPVVLEYWLGVLLYILTAFWFLKAALNQLNLKIKTEEKPDFKLKWLSIFTHCFIGYLLLRSILAMVAFFNPEFQRFNLHLNIILQQLIILSLGYIIFLRPEILEQAPKKIAKYKFSGLKPGDFESFKKRVVQLFQQDQVHLNHGLTSEYLAEELGINTYKLSQLLNTGLNTNFYGLVNYHRIKEAKKLLRSPQYMDAKLIHIALDSGFSNKSSFVRNFKRQTGLTPTEYRNKNKDSMLDTTDI